MSRRIARGLRLASPGFCAGAVALAALLPGCAREFSLSGDVVGLEGSGFTLVLNGDVEGAIELEPGATRFEFREALQRKDEFEVAVGRQPSMPAQDCVVDGPTGSMIRNGLDYPRVRCRTLRFGAGGAISGLLGHGMVIDVNGSSVPVAAGATEWRTPLFDDATALTARVATQPSHPDQECGISVEEATLSGQDRSDLDVSCVTTPYAVTGSVMGLEGDGLGLSLNGGEPMAVEAGAADFAFPPIDDGSAWQIEVVSQPDDPEQTCAISEWRGVLDGSNADAARVVCATTEWDLRGLVTGLTGEGLALDVNGDEVEIDGAGAVPLGRFPDRFPFEVTVATQPSHPAQTCSIRSGSGELAEDSAPVEIDCTTSTFAVGGVIDGLEGDGLGLALEGASTDGIDVPAGAVEFAFEARVEDGGFWRIRVTGQPSGPAQTCVVTGGEGQLEGADASSARVACTTERFRVGGLVEGLRGSGLRLAMNGEEVQVDGAGFEFQPIDDGSDWTLEVTAQPVSPDQTCAVEVGQGTLAGAEDLSARIRCVTNRYPIQVRASGLEGSGLVVRAGGGEAVEVAENDVPVLLGEFEDDEVLSVDMVVQPRSPSQICRPGAPVMVDPAAEEALVECVRERFTVGGQVSGLLSEGLVLVLNGSEELAVPPNARDYAFSTELEDWSEWEVTIGVQPTEQTCDLIAATTGQLDGANERGATVSCTQRRYDIGGLISGLEGTLVLTLNGGMAMELEGATEFNFARALTTGRTYEIAIAAQPDEADQVCYVRNRAGRVDGSSVDDIRVECVDGTVQGAYPETGEPWLRYLVDDGPDRWSASGASCVEEAAPSSMPCLHAGELRDAPLGTLASCAGVTIRDRLAAFEWVCDGSTYPVRARSLGLRAEVGLSDLIDFDAGAWRDNGVVAERDGEVLHETRESVWWTNEVIVVNDATAVTHNFFLSVPGTIHVVSTTADTTVIRMGAEQALVVAPGHWLRVRSSEPRLLDLVAPFGWIEGSLDARGASTTGVLLQEAADFVTLRDVDLFGPPVGDAMLVQGSHVDIRRIRVTGGRHGIWLNRSPFARVSGASLSHLSGSGIYMDEFETIGALLSDITVSGAGTGVFADRTANAIVTGVVALGNGTGARTDAASKHSLWLDLTTAFNGADGMLLTAPQGENNRVIGLVAFANGGDGLRIAGDAQANTAPWAEDVVSSGNGGSGVLLSGRVDLGRFTGELLLGGNGRGDCVDLTSVDSVEPGIEQGCGGSEAAVTTGVVLDDGFVGPVSDGDNGSADPMGAGVPGVDFDWWSFSRSARAWTLAGGETIPFEAAGICADGVACQIRDIAWGEGDGVGAGVVQPRLAAHAWYVPEFMFPGSTGPASDEDCDRLFRGSRWDASQATCFSAFVVGARERADDFIGNDNLLCEAGETCFASPNLGGWQGDGPWSEPTRTEVGDLSIELLFPAVIAR